MKSIYASALFNCTDLKLVTNRRMMALGIALIVLGILIYVTLFSDMLTEKWHQSVCIVLSVASLFTGLWLMMYFRKKMIYVPTGSTVRHYQLYYDRCEMDSLSMLLIAPETLSGSFCLRPRPDGDVRLDVLMSDDGQFVAAQAYLMSDYVYNTYSRLIAYGEDCTPAVVRYFRSCIVNK